MHFKRFKRGVAFALICSMALCSACGKKGAKEGDIGSSDAGNSALTEDDKNYVYKFNEIKLSEEADDWSINRDSVDSTDDALYMLAVSYSGEEGNNQKLFKLPNGADEVETIDLGADMNSSYNRFTCDNEGNLYLIREEWSYDEADDEVVEGEVAFEGNGGAVEVEESDPDDKDDTASDDEQPESDEEAGDSDTDDGISGTVTTEAESESYDDEEYNSTINSTMVKLSPDGTKLWEAPLSKTDSDNYVQAMKYIDDLGIVTISSGVFTLYNPENGESSELLKRDPIDEDYYEGSLVEGRDGKIYLLEPDSNYDEQLYPFNKETKNFEEKIDIPTDEYFGYLYPGKTYDFYLMSNDKLSAFNAGDDKVTKICDFTASDALFINADFICEPSEGNLYIYGNVGDSEYEFCRMTKVDPKDIVEKETLTVGMVGVYDMVRKQIVRFNKTNDKYRLKIVDYSGDDDANFENYYEKLSLDITNGNAPDIIMIDYYMPWESYVAKGVFEPLDSYFENDEELSKKKFLENIMEATKVDGKQYFVVPAFCVNTCVGAADMIGDDGITLQNYEAVCQKAGIDPKDGMGSYFREYGDYLYTSGNFIDYKNGKCNYNSDAFISLLKIMKNFPTYEDMTEDYDWEKYDTYYRENKSLLLPCSFYDFDYYQAVKKGYFAKDIVFNGYPGDECSKSFIEPRMQLGISSSCKNKDVAWQFLRTYYLDDFQKKLDYGFPVSEEAFDALTLKAQEKPYYIDDKGEKHETSSTWDVGGVEVEITELSKEEAEEFSNFIKSIDAMISRNNKINEILDEEAGAFYSGQKTAEEVADIIQSRVSIYLSENM